MTIENNMYQDVLEFHKKFEVPMFEKTSFLDEEAFNFRVKFMQEELDEFIEACNNNDLETAIDSLGDLVYVVLGTACMKGISYEQWVDHWNEIQRANMSKERATTAAQSKRGTILDVIKPEGWTAPAHGPIIEKYTS